MKEKKRLKKLKKKQKLKEKKKKEKLKKKLKKKHSFTKDDDSDCSSNDS